MKELTPEQIKKLNRMKAVLKKGDLELLNYLFELEERLNNDLPTIRNIIAKMKGEKGDTIKGPKGYSPVKGVDYFDGEKGYSPVKDVDYFDGKDGNTPVKGIDYFDGEDGYTPIKDIDYFDGEDGSPDSPVEVRDKLESLADDDRLDYTAIKGLEKALKDNGAKGVRLVGGMGGIILYLGGKKQGIVKMLDFEAGTGISLAVKAGTGYSTITISSSGGALTRLAATGTVNSSNKNFTFASLPTWIVSDGVWIEQKDANNVVNWSWNAGTLTATLSTAPQSSIWGF